MNPIAPFCFFITGFLSILRFIWNTISNWWYRLGWFIGSDLDPDASSPIAKPLEYNENNGYSAFNALAGFALAQAAALTAVARGEEHKLLVIGVYAATVLITLAWTVSMLRAVQTVRKEKSELINVRAYDKPSIRYGRWVVLWTFLLALMLIYLGIEGLLPNQTTRVRFAATGIQCEPHSYHLDWEKNASNKQKQMDKWIARLAGTAQQLNNEAFFIIWQRTPFQESYKPFSVQLRCNPEFLLGERTAFLVSNSPDEYMPTYRQVSFRKPGDYKTSEDTIDIKSANRGEQLIILLFARDPTKKALPNKNSVGIYELRAHFPGEARIP